MAYLVNRTQGNFTMIQNTVFRDQRLKLIDRGLLCTMMSLSDGWEFTISGMAAILPEGRDAIEASLKRLKALGYVSCYQSRDDSGKLGRNVVEVFSEPRVEEKEDQEIRLAFLTGMDPEDESEPIDCKERENRSELSTEADSTSASKQNERSSESPENRGSEPYPDFPDTEKPDTASPLTVTPPTGKPSTVFPEQYKNNQYKTKEENIYGCIHARTHAREEGDRSARKDYWLSVIDDILQGARGKLGAAAQ